MRMGGYDWGRIKPRAAKKRKAKRGDCSFEGDAKGVKLLIVIELSTAREDTRRDEKEERINRGEPQGSLPSSSPQLPCTSSSILPFVSISPFVSTFSSPRFPLDTEGIGTNGINPQVLTLPLLFIFLSTGSPR